MKEVVDPPMRDSWPLNHCFSTIPGKEDLSMHTATKRWLGVLFVLVFGAPLYAQSISDPTGDVTPAWADYTNIVYEQQGESLYVTITFAVPVSE